MVESEAEDWINRLAAALPALQTAQELLLYVYWQHNPRKLIDINGQDVTPFPLDDLRMVYAGVRRSKVLGREAEYAPLRPILDTARHALPTHPTLERVAVARRSSARTVSGCESGVRAEQFLRAT